MKPSPQDIADSLGMPTLQDKERIKHMIERYDKQHPGQLKAYRDSAKEHFQMNGDRQKYGLAGKAANMRLVFEFPPKLASIIEMAYPTMFRSRKHFHWFAKNFKDLIVGEKF